MKWREDDTIRFYRDVPDKRGVSEMVINTPSYPAYSIISGNVAYVLLPLYPPFPAIPSLVPSPLCPHKNHKKP